MNVSELLEKVEQLKVDLNFGTKETYSSPSRVFFYFDVLSKEPLNLQSKLYHVFKPRVAIWHYQAFVEESDFYKLLVLHGHLPTEVCATPHFCHVYGYKPEATDSPMFVKQFHLKWRELYGDEK